MRTISLELLRHGPPHNQLLSPLTQYLALCENHAPVSVRVPFEHNQFLHRLRALGYELGEEARSFQLRDTALELRDLFAQVPGVVAELNRSSCKPRKRGNSQELTHMRLVISASELALLPFELALAPHGFPGAGQYLLLQSQQPVCLTRETRRVTEEYLSWPEKPRILFVAASPPGVAPVPVEAHLLALRRLIDPWVKHWESDEERRTRIEEYVVFLPDATAASIEAACAEGHFTHVHILAHGVQYMEGYDVRYGLALHDDRNPNGAADIVTGERLSTILRAVERPGTEGLSRPVVVTLASCNSGNGGTVVGMGASIAHALHEAGIPLVVAGQFPISFEGSVLMVDVLYDGLLRGDDPRVTINDLRRRLHSQYPASHDWASLIAYASLPPQFERWLSEIQVTQATRAINVAMEVADRVFEGWLAPTSKRRKDLTPKEQAEQLERFERIRDKIDIAIGKLAAVLDRSDDPHARAQVLGRLASTEKRRAEVYLVHGELYEDEADVSKAEYVNEFYKSLLKARRYYWMAFEADRADPWGVVQYLSLTLVAIKLKRSRLHSQGLIDVNASPIADDEYNRIDTLWSLAKVLSLIDLRSHNETRAKWALTNLIELYVVGTLIDAVTENNKPEKVADLKAGALRYAEDFVRIAGERSFSLYSTRRQMLRYIKWFGRVADIQPAVDVASEVIKKFPEAGGMDNWT